MFETGERHAGAGGPRAADGLAQPWSESHGRLDKLERELALLEGANLERLRTLWRERYGEPPTLRSAELLRLMLAWRLQASVWGGLDDMVRRRLRPPSVGAGPTDGLPLDARVAREWKGEVHEVSVVLDGYLWRGRTYSSLSAVARAITGTRWNGPRFFGLRGDAGRP